MGSGRRNALFAVLLVLIAASGLELTAFLFGQYGLLKSRGSFLLSDPRVSLPPRQVERYFETRDPILGWPKRDPHADRGEAVRARPSPAQPSSEPAKISLYGDSFTYGSEVDDESAWGNVLARRIGQRVANYGVPGYGPDQAFLRFHENLADAAEVVVLGFIGDDILRILNQDRRLINNQYRGVRLKPRFVLDADGRLTLVPIPPITAEQLPDYLGHPERYLSHEWFLPGSRDGGVIFEFPYALAIARTLVSGRTRNLLLNRPSWLGFFAEDDESGAVPLLVGIVAAFDDLAAQRGKALRFVILPSARHLMYQTENGASPMSFLEAQLTAAGLGFLDATAPLLAELEGREICEIFTREFVLDQCGGHYNESGNAMIAGIVERDLAEQGLLGGDPDGVAADEPGAVAGATITAAGRAVRVVSAGR